MHHSSLIRLLRSLSKREVKELDKFLRSPYHNTRRSILQLFRYIRRYHPELDSPKLSKQNTFNYLFPNELFSDNKIRKQMYLLKMAVDAFVIQEQLKMDEATRQSLLIRYYYGVEDYKHFSSRIETRIKKILQKPARDASFHLELFWLFEKLFYHPKNEDHYRFKSPDPLLHLSKHLDLFYLLSKSRFQIDFNIRKRVVKENISFLIPFEDLNRYYRSLSQEYPLIWLYAHLIEFQQPRSELQVQDLAGCIDIFHDLLPQMDEKEGGFLINSLINIAIDYQNKGHEDFIPLAARLFKLADEKEMILDEGQISAPVFLNATTLGSGAQEFDWVKKFIERYKNNLDEERRENTVNLSLGAWYYHQSKLPGLDKKKKTEFLDRSLRSILTIPYAGISYDLRIRSLQLRIYYDLYLPNGPKKLFSSNKRNFEKYLSENEELSEDRKNYYKQFIRYTGQLAKYSLNKKAGIHKLKTLKKLEAKIKKDKKVAFKIWLLKAVRELL